MQHTLKRNSNAGKITCVNAVIVRVFDLRGISLFAVALVCQRVKLRAVAQVLVIAVYASCVTVAR
jgi:hypothetical protein